MFEDSLVESSGRLAFGYPWTTVASFVVQIAAIGSLLFLSLIFTDSLPTQRLIDVRALPLPPSSAPAPQSAAAGVKTAGRAENPLRVPREIPSSIATLREDVAAPGAPKGVAGDILGNVPVATLYGVMNSIPVTLPAAPRTTVQKVRVSSGVAEGMLVHEVKPSYPALARQARIEGRVLLQAEIGKDGGIENLHVISGHPLLVPATLEAVKQWRYRPYFLNGQPLEVETQIIVNFVLSNQ